jgi:beta-aspartyl-peptidase (threonine type)
MIKSALVVCTAILLSIPLFAQEKPNNMENFVLVVHGGAGTILKKNMSPEKELAYTNKLTEALKAGHAILKEGGSSVDAVQKTINILEDSPLFNAGKGAVYTNSEKNEMDASIMEGKTLNAGAVAGVTVVKNPIDAAKAVMEKSEHVMMAGDGADEFAKKQGLEIVKPSYFHDQNRLNQLRKVKDQEKTILDHDGDDRGELLPDSSEIEFNVDMNPDKKFGTVGAVALDQHGNLAAGTSTGGMTNKRYNRIGDSPIIGAGTYANNNTCAVSSTGHGEYFIRGVVAYDVSAIMEYSGVSLDEAATTVIHEKLEEMGGKGGVIALDREGNYVFRFNTAGMYRGVVKADGSVEVLIYGANDR